LQCLPLPLTIKIVATKLKEKAIEQFILDTYAGKQLPQAATDVSLTLVLKK
jgi:hypothetical protein